MECLSTAASIRPARDGVALTLSPCHPATCQGHAIGRKKPPAHRAKVASQGLSTAVPQHFLSEWEEPPSSALRAEKGEEGGNLIWYPAGQEKILGADSGLLAAPSQAPQGCGPSHPKPCTLLVLADSEPWDAKA